MKRKYEIYRQVSIFGGLVVALLYRYSRSPVFFGFLLLPFTLCAVIAAVIDRKLPPEERDNSWREWWHARHYPSPIAWAIFFVIGNILLLVPTSSQNFVAQILCVPLFATVFVELILSFKKPPRKKPLTKRQRKRMKYQSSKEVK